MVKSEGMDETSLREKVCDAYSLAAERPQVQHPFPVGRAFAEALGYPSDWLDQVPSISTEAFAGVAAVPCFAEIPEDATVLDMGCGAGLDSLLLARRVAASGRVLGLDFSWAMLERARRAAAASRTENVLFCQADAERLPLDEAAVDVAVANGIFNLNPAREMIFRELARCIRPGGWLFAAELILRESLPPEAKASECNWFA